MWIRIYMYALPYHLGPGLVAPPLRPPPSSHANPCAYLGNIEPRPFPRRGLLLQFTHQRIRPLHQPSAYLDVAQALPGASVCAFAVSHTHNLRGGVR